MENKKIIASFELSLMIVSVFAFSYMMYNSVGVFEELDDAFTEMREKRAEQIAEMDLPKPVPKQSFLMKLMGYFKKPMIPTVSAETTETIVGYDEFGQPIILTEETIVSTFEFSGDSATRGCCSLATNGVGCVTTSAGGCAAGSNFAEGALCAQTSFCQKGCCFDEASGTYDKNVLEGECPVEWNADPNCNMPGARLGCCVLGTFTIYETQGQCETDTLGRALGPNPVVDWRGDLNEASCLILSANQSEGACVLSGGNCKFGTEVDCLSYSGQFNEGTLCTSTSLETNCEMTEQTTCVEGKDGVYFVDSCGNYANIYDSSRATDPTYWNTIIAPADICGDSDVDGANANSKSCGNCNRFLGSICGSAVEDNFNVDMGNFYCKDTSCMFDGESYKNGESWCVYDGKIGDGDDVVGSRHWKYVCSQGKIQIEPCADYRNQVCFQQNTFDVDGTGVEFRNAACIANNWRECLDLNSQEGGIDRCEETLNCRIEHVAIADKFHFDVCTPKYPGGFSLSDQRYQETATKLCGMADQTCKVVYKAKTWGDCELAANGGCLGEAFAQGMNDLCRAMGDCGGEVNIVGAYTENYNVEESPMLGQGAISNLIAMATPVKGQFAEMEDYSQFLEAAGLSGEPVAPGEAEAEDLLPVNQIGMGAIGIGYAIGAVAIYSATSSLAGAVTLTAVGSNTVGSGLAGAGTGGAFAGAAMGAGIGMMVGFMIAKQLGLSPGGSILMAVGGAMVGMAVALAFMKMGAFFWPLLIIGLALMVIALFFKSKCEGMNKDVVFECKPWKPPVGGSDCEKCNEDPLKPCSEYRCKSLGAACELVNKGTEEELCHSGEDDGRPPILNPQIDVISETEQYDDITEDGFSITGLNGGCVDAYTQLMFGVITNELAYCKFDVEAKEFEDLSYDLGGNAYRYNHTTTFTLPDPSHGQSQGSEWTGDITLYIMCQDAFGHVTPNFYTAEMCVNEGPDRTPPIIRLTNPANDAIVGFDESSKNVTVVTNELATCRWDITDMAYGDMENEMSCLDTLGSQSSVQGYACNDELPTTNPENLFYIRCKDQPWLEELNRSNERNANVESAQYLLRKPEKKIEIDWIEPSQDFEVNTEMTSIELQVQTSGGGEFHWCSYSFSGYENMIKMFETGNDRVHVQPLNRPAGTDKIYVECTDETGDSVRGETEFRIIYDTSTPQIARVWQIGNTLHVITTEPAECVYSTDYCNFNWDDGTPMTGMEEFTIGVIAGKKYHIKCKDEFGNAPSGCSISVRAI